MSITEETRREAYYESQNKAPTRRYKIYRLLKEKRPHDFGRDHGHVGLHKPNSVRPRLTELKQAGLIETCGKKLAKCGKIHISVWQVVEGQ